MTPGDELKRVAAQLRQFATCTPVKKASESAATAADWVELTIRELHSEKRRERR